MAETAGAGQTLLPPPFVQAAPQPPGDDFTVWVVGPFHTPGASYDRTTHCAFTNRMLTTAAMLAARVPRYVELHNEHSETEAPNKVTVLTEAERGTLFPDARGGFVGDAAVVGSPGWRAFDERVRAYLARHATRPGDVVLHMYGAAHAGLVGDLPHLVHVDASGGSTDREFGAFRLFDSNAHRSWQLSRAQELRRCLAGVLPPAAPPPPLDPRGASVRYSWVVPTALDPRHWRPPVGSPGQADYVLFLGRAVPSKGVVAFAAIAEAWQRANGTALRFVAVGQGTDRLVNPPPGVDWRPAVHTTAERAALLAGARCVVVPTETHEPWACVSVEAQCMGTPVLASPSGGLCENVKHGRSGFHCRTLGDWLAGIAAVGRLDRARVAARAWRRWGTDAVAPGLLAALLEARDAHVGAGWQTPVTRRADIA